MRCAYSPPAYKACCSAVNSGCVGRNGEYIMLAEAHTAAGWPLYASGVLCKPIYRLVSASGSLCWS